MCVYNIEFPLETLVSIHTLSVVLISTLGPNRLRQRYVLASEKYTCSCLALGCPHGFVQVLGFRV